jgi:23S rRNA (uracil1939-C5)-methyltransferase
MQQISYKGQLEAKCVILADCFSRIGKFASEIKITVHPSPPLGYRNRVEFHLDSSSARPHVGFKARRAAEIEPLNDCPIADAGIRDALIRGDIELLAPPSGKNRWVVYSRDGAFFSEGGTRRGKVRILDRDILMDAGLFFQSNAVMQEELISELKCAAARADHHLPLADIYCGVGVFSAFLADDFTGLDLVEKGKDAISLARENLRGCAQNGETNFYALSDDEWVRLMRRRQNNWGFMVIDPPRNGLSASMRGFLAKQGAALLAYVSCDPATLARDAGSLRAAGYTLTALHLYDFYPQTSHIESLALFSRE